VASGHGSLTRRAKKEVISPTLSRYATANGDVAAWWSVVLTEGNWAKPA
jgi:hypothetical protein